MVERVPGSRTKTARVSRDHRDRRGSVTASSTTNEPIRPMYSFLPVLIQPLAVGQSFQSAPHASF